MHKLYVKLTVWPNIGWTEYVWLDEVRRRPWHGPTTAPGVIYTRNFSHFCRSSSSNWGDWEFTNCLLFPFFFWAIWALKMAAWFLWQENVANIAVASRFWLATSSYDCLILSFHWFVLPWARQILHLCLQNAPQCPTSEKEIILEPLLL